MIPNLHFPNSVRFFFAFAPLRETLLTLIGVGILAGNASAQNWDRFRGPNGAGQAEADGVPNEWKPENFLWKQPLPGLGHSSPVVWDNKLFIMSSDVDSGEQIVLAFDALGGKPLWQKRYEANSYSHHGFNTFASSTPAVDAQHVFVMWLVNDRIKLAALTHKGDEVWQQDIGPFQEDHGFGKSPIVIDGIVYVATDSEAESAIIALDGISGDVRWRIPRPSGTTAFASPCLLDPAAGDKQLLALSTAAGLTAIDLASGQVAWHGLEEDIPLRCVSSPIVAGGLVFVACGQGGNGKLMIAAKPGDATHGPEEMYRLEQSIPNVPTPVVAGDLLFLWHDRGVVTCHDVATGRKVWRERVGGDFHSSPIRIGNRILCVSRDGEAVILAADRKFELLARNSLGEGSSATPAVAHNRLYVRTASTLSCVGTP